MDRRPNRRMNLVVAGPNLGVFGKLLPNFGSGLTATRRQGGEASFVFGRQDTKQFLNGCSQYMLNKHSGWRLQGYGFQFVFT
jgi:hypothetical protein